jgi:serine/threonine protein kinase
MVIGSVKEDKRYEKVDKLGEGTYGIVYKVKDRTTN